MPRYGPRVLGEKEYKRQTEAEVGGRSIYGPKVTGYVPHTAEKPAPGEAVDWPISVRGMKAQLAAHPEQVVEAAQAELASDSPRKGALNFLLDFDLDAELHAAIREKLVALEG